MKRSPRRFGGCRIHPQAWRIRNLVENPGHLLSRLGSRKHDNTKNIGGCSERVRKRLLGAAEGERETLSYSDGCSMAASARAFLVSRVTDPSLAPHHAPLPPFSGHLLARPMLPASAGFKRRPAGVLCCLVSGVDGGGVSDDFVSTRKASFDRGFAVIANMLNRIEPLDNSVISKGVSDSAKDSMKQTISTMLGLLPSDQFSVTVRVSKRPLDRLLASSIITG